MIFEPIARSAQNRAPILRVDQNYLQTNKNELPFDPRHLGGPLGVAKKISMPVIY
jgi:hypothetical protein